MKQLKTIKRLTAFGLLVLMTACSTENTVIGNVGVSDVIVRLQGLCLAAGFPS